MLSDFIRAIKRIGIPSRIRVDKGGEYAHIKRLMNKLNGDEHKSSLSGKSVHNIRIERLWRDVFSKVLSRYYIVFTTMENNHILDVENGIQMSVLHHVYSRRIQQDLSFWVEAHNRHPLRTEENKSPTQLWYTASLISQNRNNTAMHNLFRREYTEYMDVLQGFEEEHLLAEQDNIEHVLPRFPLPVTNAQLKELNDKFDVVAESEHDGVDIYYDILKFIQQSQSI